MILIVGIGNIFLGDDAFGSEVARRLLQHHVPSNVVVKDLGIRAVDLLYSLMDSYDRVIIVDATPRGGEPGSIYLLEPAETDFSPSPSGRGRREAPGEGRKSSKSWDPHPALSQRERVGFAQPPIYSHFL